MRFLPLILLFALLIPARASALDDGPRAMLPAAFALWRTVGPFEDPSITFFVADDNPAYAEATAAYAWADRTHGTITIWHKYFDQLTPIQQQVVIDHEVGHILGIDQHVGDPDALMSKYGEASIGGPSTEPHLTDADRLAFLAVHPLPSRGFAVVAR